MTTATFEKNTNPDLASAQLLAQKLASVTRVPTFVVAARGHYFVQDAADLECYWTEGGALMAGAAIVARYEPDPPPPFVDPLPSDAPGGDNDTVPGDERPRAVTLQSQQIDATMQRNRLCPICQGAHYGWQCPSIRRPLFAASWVGADLGRGLCQMLWRNHAGFVELLTDATPARLREYAESYIAFLRDNRADCDLTIKEVLAVWVREMGGDRVPAAPAMRKAA